MYENKYHLFLQNCNELKPMATRILGSLSNLPGRFLIFGRIYITKLCYNLLNAPSQVNQPSKLIINKIGH